MTMRVEPSEQKVVPGRDEAPFTGSDQRVFPRIKTAKKIVLSVGADTFAGETYDIGQGGLCFIAVNPIDLGPAVVRIANSNFIFQGKVLACHKSGISATLHFHFQFDKSVDLATLAVMLGI